MKKVFPILVCALVLLALVACNGEFNTLKMTHAKSDVYLTMKDGSRLHIVLDGTSVPSNFLVVNNFISQEEYDAINSDLETRFAPRAAETEYSYKDIVGLYFENVEKVERRAFAACEENLKSVVFGDDAIETIEEEAFTKASGLEEVQLAQVQKIGKRAFYAAGGRDTAQTVVTIESEEQVEFGEDVFGTDSDLSPANIIIVADEDIFSDEYKSIIENIFKDSKISVTFKLV